MRRVALLARAADPIARALSERLQGRGAEAAILELGSMAHGAPLAWDGEEWLFNGATLSEFDAFFVRQEPAETAVLGAPGERGTSEEWWLRALRAQTFSHLAQSFL